MRKVSIFDRIAGTMAIVLFLVCSVLGMARPARAEISLLDTLYTFSGDLQGAPTSPLVQAADGNFYGTIVRAKGGAVYKMTPSGAATVVYRFVYQDFHQVKNGETIDLAAGPSPQGLLCLARNGRIYGVAYYPDRKPDGPIAVAYEVTLTGHVKKLFDFTQEECGGIPTAGLVEGDDGWFYGTTRGLEGQVYKISPDGEYKTLVSFAGINKGCGPKTVLTRGHDGNYYGIVGSCLARQSWVFKVTPDGVLSVFCDGLNQPSRLTLGPKDCLYGTDSDCGCSCNSAVVFKISPDGSYSEVHAFTDIGSYGVPVDDLSAGPDGSLFGALDLKSTLGGVYTIKPGDRFKVLHRFTAEESGHPPACPIPAKDGIVYGPSIATLYKITTAGSVISLNFVGGHSGDKPATLKDADIAGLTPAEHWNNLSGNTGAMEVVDDIGAKTGTTVTWSSADTGLTSIADDKPDSRLMRGYLDTSKESETSVQVWGLPTEYVTNGYDVLVYCDGDGKSMPIRGKYSIEGTSIAARAGAANFAGDFVECGEQGGNYMAFRNLTARGFLLKAVADPEPNSSAHTVINGMQIILH